MGRELNCILVLAEKSSLKLGLQGGHPIFERESAQLSVDKRLIDVT